MVLNKSSALCRQLQLIPLSAFKTVEFTASGCAGWLHVWPPGRAVSATTSLGRLECLDDEDDADDDADDDDDDDADENNGSIEDADDINDSEEDARELDSVEKLLVDGTKRSNGD